MKKKFLRSVAALALRDQSSSILRFKSMQVKLLSAWAALLLSTSVFADQRAEKIAALIEAQGLTATFEQQINAGREYGRQEARSMLDRLMKGLNPSEAFKKRFEQAAVEFTTDLQPPWGAKEIVDVWAQYYGESFTDEELDRLLTFYTSPLAQKEVVATRQSLVRFSEHFQAKYRPIMEQATAAYIQKLQVIAKECQCKR